ncbi:CD44 antigen isoform X11 [Vombatus ursinus]|nr:CD44 antigen isoform X11 [Vombatus ursinus]
MDNSWSRTIWGLFLVQLSLAQIELNITCRYAGVYHVEKNGRYSISRTEAADLCKAFNSTLPTLKQMEQALSIGFETCRYGFIDGHVVIPRKTPRFLCAANNTGVYILPSNMSQYDTYCFNASAPLDKEDCSYVTDIPSVFEGQITIGIVNPDGTRYTKKGEYRTNPEDINPSFTPEDDGSSGSAGERSTMGGSTIIQTTYDDVTPTSSKDLITEHYENFPAVTNTAPHHSTADPMEGWLEDKGTTHYPPMATAEHNHPQSTSRPHTGLEDGHEHSPAPSPTSLTDGDDGLGYGSLPEDSTTPVEDSFIHFPGKNENTAHSSVTPVTTGLPGVTKPTVSGAFIPDNTRVPSDHDGSRAGQPRRPDVTTYSTPVPDGNQGQSEQNPNLKRKPKIPEWLIILSALLALALILAVCIAVNSRRRCGQKKKLVINNGNGAVDDKKTPGLNGDASKSQEMVHLVNKEPFDSQVGQDECMTADETRNLQNVDMKIGV